MNITTQFDFASVPQNQGHNVRLMIALEGEMPSDVVRPKLNIALVLDRSGSMSGEKIANVKQAAKRVIENLADDDIVSLTIFDNHVDTVLTPTRGGNVRHLDELMSSFDARYNTCLSGGYAVGYEHASRFIDRKSISRIFLLTDGLANDGITDRDLLVDISRKYCTSGVSTTTIGTGADYDEHLLGKMAQAGEGNTYFIEKPDDAVSVFTEELGYLVSLCATGTTILFRPKCPLNGVAQLNSFAVQDGGAFMIGDVYGGQTKRLILELQIPPRAEIGTIDLGEVTIAFSDASGRNAEGSVVTLPITLNVVDAASFAGVFADPDVTFHSALLMISNAKNQAMSLANEDRFEEASDLLLRTAVMIEQLHLGNPMILTEVAALRVRASELKQRRREYYTATERKRMYYEQEMMMTSNMPAYNRMMERRNRRV